MSTKKLLERRQQDDEATAYAFKEFLETFQTSAPVAKTFIQSGIYNPGVNDFNSCATEQSGKIYAPTPLYKSSDIAMQALECARLVKYDRSLRPQGCKSKTNLEELKEELQQRHQHVENIHKISGNLSTPPIFAQSGSRRKQIELDQETIENTTNLFLTHINTSLNEQDLMQIFGVYGPLASVKIMWPRVPTSHRNFNIGFVGYMSRSDCQQAFYALGNRSDMRISWGKPIEIPAQPIYIPPELVKMLLPPPCSGLPFNAQFPNSKNEKRISKQDLANVDLTNTYVKVTIPLDKKILLIIHRMIEFVIREGTSVETMIMRKERNNPLFQFLFDNQSSMHTYYRWKLYSVLHGESINSWDTTPFRMFRGGSLWIPPTSTDFTKGMSWQLASGDAFKEKGRLHDSEQLTLIKMIQNLTPDKTKVAQAMVFCIDNIHGARDIVNIITESIEINSKNDMSSKKQIARLYLISDILYNAKHKKYAQFINNFTNKISGIFDVLKLTLQQYNQKKDQRLKNIVKLKIMNVLKAWEMWRIFPKALLEQLESELKDPPEIVTIEEKRTKTENILKSKEKQSNMLSTSNEMQELELHETFSKSRWETQTPDVLQAQAMSTARLHEIEVQRKYEEELHKQTKISKTLHYQDLRKVEMKVIRYQDSLEGGKRKLKYAQTIEGDVNEYRKRCINKFKSRQQEKDNDIFISHKKKRR